MKRILMIGMFFLGLCGYSQTATTKVVKHKAKKEIKSSVGIETTPAKTAKKAVGIEPTPAEKAKKATVKKVTK